MSVSYRLSDVYDLQMGKTPSRDKAAYWEDGQYEWISIADMSKCDKYINQTKEKITQQAVEDSGIRIIPAETVIMSFKLSIGKVAITQKALFSNEAIMAFIDKGVVPILPQYAYYLFSAQKWDKGANRAVMGTTLNKATLSQYRVAIHDIQTQNEIIERLNRLTDLIKSRKQQLQKLDDLVKSQFIEMFGEDEYPEQSLSECCTFIDYRGKTPEKASSGIRLITAKNVRMHYLKDEPAEYVPARNYDAIMTRGIPPLGSILFTTEAPLGNVCRIPNYQEKFCIGQRLLNIIPRKELNSLYLEYQLASEAFQNEMRKKSSGSTVTGIRAKELIKLKIPVPPLELQNEFARFVEQTDKSKVLIKWSKILISTLLRVEKSKKICYN